MIFMIVFSTVVVMIDILVSIFDFNILPLNILMTVTLIMAAFVSIITSFYVKYDAESQTTGLTIWSIHKAKEWFKGRKLNEREGEKIIVNWKEADDDKDELSFSKNDIKKMSAEVGDLVYISDTRKWMGGLKSCHSVIGEPHDEDGIVYIRKKHITNGLFVKFKPLEAEKEM